MRIEERNMLHEMAEQLKASNVALRELIHMALDAKPEIVPFLRNIYELNDAKLTRAYEMLDKENNR